MIRKAIVYILYDRESKKILVENRIDGQTLTGQKVFPGGKVEESETNDLDKTFLREIFEELGINPVQFVNLKRSVIGEPGWILYPYVVFSWKGKIPDKVLDKGSLLEWVDLDDFEPTHHSVKELLKLTRECVAQS